MYTSPDVAHLCAEEGYPVGPGGTPGGEPWAFGTLPEAYPWRNGAEVAAFRNWRVARASDMRRPWKTSTDFDENWWASAGHYARLAHRVWRGSDR